VENTYKGEGVQGGPKAVPTEDLFVTPTQNTSLIISQKPPEQPAIELDEASTKTMPAAEETELEEAMEQDWDSDWTNLEEVEMVWRSKQEDQKGPRPAKQGAHSTRSTHHGPS
jgi:hypothetical protein